MLRSHRILKVAFSPDEMLRFAELLAVITACITKGEATGKYSTSSKAKEALAEFGGRLRDQSRRYTIWVMTGVLFCLQMLIRGSGFDSVDYYEAKC